MPAVTPLISVIIPVYNADRYVAECLDSVLKQTLKPYELIVINDGSTDGSLAALEPYADRIRLYSHENAGVARTLNEGIGLAGGELIAFLDADDYWETEKLALQARFLAENQLIDACFGHIRPFISPDLPADIQAGIHCPAYAQAGWLKATMLIRRPAFEKTGLFDPAYHTGDFIDWFIRAKEAGLTCAMLPDVVAYRRLHRSGLSSRQQYHHEFARILKAKLDRHVRQ